MFHQRNVEQHSEVRTFACVEGRGEVYLGLTLHCLQPRFLASYEVIDIFRLLDIQRLALERETAMFEFLGCAGAFVHLSKPPCCQQL